MKQNYQEIRLGRCLNEYRHPEYDELIKECIGFVNCSLGGDPSGNPIMFEPKCGPMQEVHGLFKDSDKKVLLRYIIDSSD